MGSMWTLNNNRSNTTFTRRMAPRRAGQELVSGTGARQFRSRDRLRPRDLARHCGVWDRCFPSSAPQRIISVTEISKITCSLTPKQAKESIPKMLRYLYKLHLDFYLSNNQATGSWPVVKISKARF